MIYFDNGASTYPKPPSVVKAVSSWMQKNGANPGRSGHKMSMEAAELIYNTRVAYANLFGLKKPECVILVPNATYALNMVLFGLFEKGDHIITTDLEHNSVLRPLWQLQERGVAVSVVPVDFKDDRATITSIMNAIRKNTKAIICTQCSNICGRILPIGEISNKKPKDILLIVDGSQGAGSIITNVSEMGIDYYCAPSHKGLMGPQGGGILLINNRAPRPLIFGGTGNESLKLDQPKDLPEHLESGTLPAPICAGMLAAAEFIQSNGLGKICDHKRNLTQYAYSELKNLPKIELYMAPYAQHCIGVIPFNIKDKSSSEVGELLDRYNIFVRSGIHCAPLFHLRMGTEHRGMVRISFGFMNQMREIDHLIKILKKSFIFS